MRVYLPLSPTDIALFISSKSIQASKLYAPTIKFITDNVGHDEEEIEYMLSLLAATDAMQLVSGNPKIGTLLALEIDSKEIAIEETDSIVLTGELVWDRVECLFTSVLDEEGDIELTWYATQEIEDQLAIIALGNK
ncbi:MAG: hypothetical protein NTZ06_05005 [Actinobacteria bacterium]|nr:hypothetical protein [Actinomycetota bacterium]